MNTENQLGVKIKSLRKSMGYTQQQLAELANIDDKHLSKIENGIHEPSFKTLQSLSKVLNFDLLNMGATPQENNPLIQNHIYQKAMKILNSAKSEKELQNYYDALKLTNRLMK